MPYIGPAPADSIVDSAGITSGAVDLAHMSSESVDEDNLYISNSGSNGQFLSKQSGDSGGLTWAAAGDPASADGESLGTASLEWSDLYLADGGVIYFGNDQDVTLTHDPDDGLLLNETLAVGDGTSSLPSLTNVGDLHTGLFFPSNDQMGFSTGGTERHRFNGAQVHFNDTENGNLSAGLSISQAGNDNEIFALKSSDVAHGCTADTETDTFMQISKIVPASGGTKITGYSEGTKGLLLRGQCTTANTAKSTSADAPVVLRGVKKSSTSNAVMGSDENVVMIEGCTAGPGFIFDAEGSMHSNASNAVYDEYDDAQLVRTIDQSLSTKGLIASKFDEFVQYSHEDLADAGLVGRDDDGTPNGYVNWMHLAKLHNGAIWQQHEKHENLLNAVYELAAEAVGKDKADDILDRHAIKPVSGTKLLN